MTSQTNDTTILNIDTGAAIEAIEQALKDRLKSNPWSLFEIPAAQELTAWVGDFRVDFWAGIGIEEFNSAIGETVKHLNSDEAPNGGAGTYEVSDDGKYVKIDYDRYNEIERETVELVVEHNIYHMGLAKEILSNLRDQAAQNFDIAA